MTTPVAERAGTAGARAEIVDVADNVVALLRTVNRARARMLAAAAHDVEWSAHVLLKILHTEGPVRAGAVAEALQSDPSTVSRQVAALVKDGLVERRSDPDDGRASLLVLTTKADAVMAEHDIIRLDFFDRMLETWSSEDLGAFAAHLERFTADYDAANSSWLATRMARRSETTGGNP